MPAGDRLFMGEDGWPGGEINGSRLPSSSLMWPFLKDAIGGSVDRGETLSVPLIARYVCQRRKNCLAPRPNHPQGLGNLSMSVNLDRTRLIVVRPNRPQVPWPQGTGSFHVVRAGRHDPPLMLPSVRRRSVAQIHRDLPNQLAVRRR